MFLPGAIKRLSLYQQPTLNYFQSAANCTGSEQNYFSCNSSNLSSSSICTSDAGLICQGERVELFFSFSLFILVADSSPQPSNCSDFDIKLEEASGGKLLICFNGVWGTVCNGGLYNSAGILCDQLGFQKKGILDIKC